MIDSPELPPGSAAEYDDLAGAYIREGNFEMARLALLARDIRREQGDTSTEIPHGSYTADDFDAFAADLEKEGEMQVAALARHHAARLREEQE